MQTRELGPFTVTAIGLGCMNLSHAYGAPPSAEQGEKLLRAAVDMGVTLFDTAALYGFASNEKLLGRVLKPHRQQITLCSKGGMAGVPDENGVPKRVIDGRPEAIYRDCENSLRNLQTDVIDLYYLHRWDKKIPIEESVGAMSRLVEQGKVRTLGLSEVGAATIRKAHAVHPITAVQTEYSLWTRDPEQEVLPTVRELGIGFVPYSPLGRGFLTGTIRSVDALAENDFRRFNPRFEGDNLKANIRIVEQVDDVARAIGSKPGQVALAWLLAQGEDIAPIPGTKRIPYLEENVAADAVVLSEEHLAQLNEVAAAAGDRYADMSPLNR